MSAMYGMEVAEPNMGELRARVELMRVARVSLGQDEPLFSTGLGSTGWVV